MNLAIISILGCTIILMTFLIWLWFMGCERTCVTTDYNVQKLFQEGSFLSVLILIDSTDARCHCTRFTSGDAPFQYTLAQLCLQELLSSDQRVEVEALLAHTRSPILRELARFSEIKFIQ
jgi:hypothetical protein